MSERLEPINYDLSGEIQIKHRRFLPIAEDIETVLPAGSMIPTIATQESFDYAYVHEMISSNSNSDGASGSRIHYAVINNEVVSSSVTVLSLDWGSCFQEANTQFGLAELVGANPNRRFLVYDEPGVGRSDPITPSLSREIARTGRFDKYAEIIVNGLSAVIKDYDGIDLLGRSLGGIVATEMAPQIGNIGSLMVFDPPSTPKTRLQFTESFVLKERQHAHGYAEHAPKQTADVNLQGISFSKIVTGVIDQLWSGKARTRLFDIPTAMTQGTYTEPLTDALPHVRDHYAFLSPTHSEMNRADHAKEVIIKALKGVDILPSTVEQVIFNGTHAFGFGNPKALAALETHVLNNKQ